MPELQEIADAFGIPDDALRNIDPGSPPQMRMMAAMGTLPVPPRVLMSILYVLMGDPDEKVAATAKDSLLGMPTKLLVANIDPKTHPKILEFLAMNQDDEDLLEAIVLRRTATDATLCYVAETGSAKIIEIIAGNQERTLVTPEITLHIAANENCTAALLDRLKSWQRMNGVKLPDVELGKRTPAGADAGAEVQDQSDHPAPAAPEASPPGDLAGDEAHALSAADNLTGDDELLEGRPYLDDVAGPPMPVVDEDTFLSLLRDMGIELQPEYFDHGTAGAAPSDADEQEQRKASRQIDVDEQALEVDLLTPLAGMGFTFTLDNSDDDWDSAFLMDHGDEADDDLRADIATKMMKLTVGQKIKLAYVGNKEVRGILIRDSNRMVCTAVVKSGRMTDPEVTKLATNRAVSEEVLRLIAQNKEWTRKYPVKVALVNNPKCPVGTAMQFLSHLHPKDLKNVSNNKNVSSVIFNAAKKRVLNKTG
jgi:hypothetical protein